MPVERQATSGATGGWQDDGTVVRLITVTDAVVVGATTQAGTEKFRHTGGPFLLDGVVGATPVAGAGTRVMWIPDRASLRAGVVSGTHWNDANVGAQTYGFGSNVKLTTGTAFGAGDEIDADGQGYFIGTNLSGSGFQFGDSIQSDDTGNVLVGRSITSVGGLSGNLALGVSITFGGSSQIGVGLSHNFGVGSGALLVGTSNTSGASGGTAFGNSVTVDNNAMGIGISATANDGLAIGIGVLIDAGAGGSAFSVSVSGHLTANAANSADFGVGNTIDEADSGTWGRGLSVLAGDDRCFLYGFGVPSNGDHRTQLGYDTSVGAVDDKAVWTLGLLNPSAGFIYGARLQVHDESSGKTDPAILTVKAGVASIAGYPTFAFEGNVIPSVDNKYDLGIRGGGPTRWYGLIAGDGGVRVTQDVTNAVSEAFFGSQTWNNVAVDFYGMRYEVVANTASGAGSRLLRLAVANSPVFDVDVTGALRSASFWEGPEIADPAAPVANFGRAYFRDNGAGKTQYVVRFNTGTVQVLATEP